MHCMLPKLGSRTHLSLGTATNYCVSLLIFWCLTFHERARAALPTDVRKPTDVPNRLTSQVTAK
eukprot:2118923-Amphidinium_carterae.1